jgi:NDP-sugar pyrophosphorylase family protein
MKAMVLAAGLGTRLRPLTLLAAKPALPVLNRPLLHWTLEHLARQGIEEVLINTHHLPATVRRAAGSGRAFGLTLRYAHEPRILGTGGGPRSVRAFFGGECALLVNGDVFFDFDLRRILARHRASGARATLVLKDHPRLDRYGAVMTGPGGWVRSLAGLPRPTPGRAALFTGIHVLDPALLERLPSGPSDSVRDLYAPMLAEGERLLGLRVRGAWYDFGSPSLYLASQMSLLSRGFGRSPRGPLRHPTSRVHPRARLRRSVVGAGSVIDADAEVSGSVLWQRVKVGRGARVRSSILVDGVRVEKGEVVEGQVVIPARRLDRAPRGSWLCAGRYFLELTGETS